MRKDFMSQPKGLRNKLLGALAASTLALSAHAQLSCPPRGSTRTVSTGA